MANIYNGDLKRELISAVGIQTAREQVPNQIADKVVPVIDVNPNSHRIINIITTSYANNANATIYTTPTNKDFYLTSVVLCRTKDAASDDTYSFLGGTIEGAQVSFIRLSGITLTAQQQEVAINYPLPVKIDRGTTITLSKTSTTVGVNNLTGSISGYTVENGNV